MIKHRVACSEKKFFKLLISCKISNEMFDVVKEICKVIIFWCQDISKHGVANGAPSNVLNLFSRIRVIVEQGQFVVLFYYLKLFLFLQ